MSAITLNKLKADEYLQEFADETGEDWLKALINEIILIRKVPEKTFLDKIYNDFLIACQLKKNITSNNQPTSKRPAVSKTEPVKHNFILEKLEHESGVNALTCGSTIPFHDMLTVIYGNNGCGKSGFVRILKKISGSRTQEEIWQNIHKAKTKNRCKAKITYKNIEGVFVKQWNGESKISPFNKINIFDGKCIPIYLNEGLEFSYQPYGFELFQALSFSFQELQKRLTDDINNALRQKPDIGDLFNEDTVIGKFVSHLSSTTKKEDIDKLPAWNQNKQKTLVKKIEERNGLKNFDQQTELLRTRNQKIKILEKTLLQIQSDLSTDNLRLYAGLIVKFKQLKKKLVTKKDQTLEDYDIPEMESEEWENFVKAAEDYINLSQNDNYPEESDHCIYCRQKLSKTASQLIKLYREIFQEQETSDLSDVETKIDEVINDLGSISFSDDFPYSKDDFNKILNKKTLDDAFSVMNEADKLTKKLISSLKESKKAKLRPIKLSGLLAQVKKTKIKVEADIEALKNLKLNISHKSKELDRAIEELQDIQKFSKCRSDINKYIQLEKWITRANSLLKTRINTKPITTVGKKAWQELISESFRDRFQNEANYLEAPIVNIGFRGEYGLQKREKSLEGLNQIDDFLSEGEQKAIALADFFAELSIQHEKTPIIFDDPATSFDHQRKELIAKRIVKESDTRQVIVFTHDLMFANYIHEQVEDNKGDLIKTKAVFHNLENCAGSVGLVSENDYPGAVRFNGQIQKVEEKLSFINSLKGEEKREAIRNAYGKLRRAVEKAIEEKIFGKVIMRWSDQIRMNNVQNATLSKSKLEAAKKLHENFSRFIDAHDQSNEMIQHSVYNIEKLKLDIQQVKNLALSDKN